MAGGEDRNTVLRRARGQPNTRAMVDCILRSSMRERDLRWALRELPRNRKVVMTHTLHNCVARDDLRTLESLLPRVQGARNQRNQRQDVQMPDIVNAPLGHRDYISLCIAAYNGSSQSVKFLISQGADVTYVNSHGEDLTGTLANGEHDAVEANPSNTIFTRERYRQCRKFIHERQDFLRMQAERGPVTYQSRCPPKVRAALVIWAWWKGHRPQPDTGWATSHRHHHRRGRHRGP
jgi:hypothetical protein